MKTAEPTTIEEAIEWAQKYLFACSHRDPTVEAHALLGGLLDYSSALLQLNGFEEITQDVREKFKTMVVRRGEYEPVAYLFGKKNFFGRDFQVDRRVLVPRPETELLVEEALELAGSRGWTNPKVLDVGTGSGCIAITLALSFLNKCEIIAVDASSDALQVAAVNVESLQAKAVKFLKSNLYEMLQDEHKGYFDMIVSNPPYIESSTLLSLDPDIKFEPGAALDGGADGLDVIRPLVQKAPDYLRPNGILLLEIGYDQGERVRELFQQAGFQNIQIRKDYSGHDRIISGELSGSI